jgi:hypothetical protein
MNFRLTLALVFILTMVAVVFFWAQTRGPDKKADETPANALLNPAPGPVTSIALSDGNPLATKISFAKTDGKWRLVKPRPALANTYTLDAIADDLKSLTYKQKYAPEPSGSKSLEFAGLAAPLYSIQFTDQAGHNYTLLLGKRTSTGSLLARIDGDKTQTIYMLAGNPVDRLDKDPDEFREKQLVDLPTDRVTSLTVRHPDQKVVLRKGTPAAKWLIEQPIPARANASAADDLLRDLRGLQAESFASLARTEPATGLSAPVLTISAFAPDAAAPATTTASASQPAGQTVTIAFGNYTDLTKKSIYAALAGSDDVVVISVETFDRLNKQFKDLRDPAITPVAVTEATTLDFRGSSESSGGIALTKKDGQWQVTLSGPFAPLPAESAEVTKLLETIRDLRANKFVDGAGDLKSIGLAPPQRTITLTVPGQSQQDVLLIGTPQTAEPLTPVMRQGETTVYLVQTPELAKLSPTIQDLRNRAVTTLDTSNIREIHLKGPAVKYPLTISQEKSPLGGTQWSCTIDGKKYAADNDKILALLGDLHPLTAQKWLGAVPFPTDAKPAATLELLVADAAPTTQATSAPAVAGPVLPRLVTVELRVATDKDAAAVAQCDAATPNWLFQPTAALVDHLTKVDYRPASATQPATSTAPVTSEPRP